MAPGSPATQVEGTNIRDYTRYVLMQVKLCTQGFFFRPDHCSRGAKKNVLWTLERISVFGVAGEITGGPDTSSR